jgi:hypothetical protein
MTEACRVALERVKAPKVARSVSEIELAIERLNQAWTANAQETGMAQFFGIVATWQQTVHFRWRNALTGANGLLANVAAWESVPVATALLERIGKLRGTGRAVRKPIARAGGDTQKKRRTA